VTYLADLYFFCFVCLIVAIFGATFTLRNRVVLPLVVYYCYAMRFPLPRRPSELTRKHRAFVNALGAMQLTSCENHLRISPDLFLREAASYEWKRAGQRSKGMKSRRVIYLVSLWVSVVYPFSYTSRLENKDRMSELKTFY